LAFRQRPTAMPLWMNDPASWKDALALVILAVVLGTAFMQASTFPLHHVDAVTCFGLKAKALFSTGTFRTSFFYQHGIVHVQPDYPLLVPYLEALYYQFSGGIDDLFVTHLFLIYGICLLLLVFQSLRARLDRTPSLLLIAMYGSLPLFLRDQDTQVVAGGADILFMLYETAAVVAAGFWIDAGTSGWRRLTVLGSLGCLFCKPQGVVFCALLWMALYFFLAHDRRSWGTGLGQLVIVSLPWMLTAHGLPREIIFPPLVISKMMLLKSIAKIAPLVGALVREPWRISQWGLFWPVMVMLLFWKKSAFNAGGRLIWVVVTLQFVAYLAVYLIYPQPIHWWIASSFTRWLTHGTALILLAAGWGLSTPVGQEYNTGR